MNKKKMLAALALVGSLSLVTACGSGGNDEAAGSSQAPSSQSGSEQAAAPTPDLDDVPDVVATVNGTDIGKDEFSQLYKSQFQQAAMQAQMSGQDMSDQTQLKKQAAEAMVGSELLMQHAEKAGLKASKADLDKALADAAKQNQMDTKQFLAALEKQGMDRKAVDDQLKHQVEIGGIVEKEAGPFKASDKELKAAYEQAKKSQAQQGGASGSAPAMPEFKDVKPKIKEQIIAQKESQAADELAQKLRKDADVKINL